MRVLVTGAAGQLGVEILRHAPKEVRTIGLSREECDVTDSLALEHAMNTHRPEVVINAAAYTAVDAAEALPDLAHAVNATGAGNVARAAVRVGARIIHVSTDYVFDGVRDTPYPPDSPTNPLNMYGRSKLAGEQEIQRYGPNILIIRTGWLYASHGRNFLRTVLSSLQASRPVRVVNDQVGVPTSARDFAAVIWKCAVRNDLRGIEHWVNAGTASWYDFAIAIQQLAVARGLIRLITPISAVTSAEYNSRADRPRYSVLDASGLKLAVACESRSWENALAEIVVELQNDNNPLSLRNKP